MFKMLNKKYNLCLEIFSLFLFFILFSVIQNNTKFTYPKAINLINGNILIIHKTGIAVYDSSLKYLIFSVKNFTNDELIEFQKLSKLSISIFRESQTQDDSSIIISIINNKIYIFNYNGELLYEEKSQEIIDIIADSSYLDLTNINIDGTLYNYMISFTKNSEVNLHFFQYNKANNKNNHTKTETFKPKLSGNTKNFKNEAISCEIMSDSTEDNILACFLCLDNDGQAIIISIFFDLNEYKVKNNTESKYFQLNNVDIKGFKSVASLDKKKILICVRNADTSSFCRNYTIDDNQFSETQNYNIKCKDGHYCLSLQYMNEKNQYSFSCTDNYGKLNFLLFDDNFCPITESISVEVGNNANGASIIYSNGNYYVISDGDREDSIQNINENLGYTIVIISSEVIKKTDEPTTILAPSSPSTIPTIPTIPQTIPSYICNLEKCEICNEESYLKNLCIKCNKKNKFYQISPFINYNSFNNSNYMECYNISTKPSNFYLNKTTEFFEPCYKSCATCNYPGDGNQNNCTTCDVDYMKEPENPNSTNCISACTYYYYISYGQYKCTILPQCPDQYNLLIREKRKCIDNCIKDSEYKYQYNGECLEKCPEDTIQDEKKHLCKIKDVDSCTESSTSFELYDFLKEGGVEKIAKIYANEFNYTNKHISIYKNEVYSIMIYKYKNCITELGLPMPEIDFGKCYDNLQNNYKLENENLIVMIIDKKNNKTSNPITSYAFYNPRNGERMNSEQICKEDDIIVKENIKSILNDTDSDIDSILFLAGQNIDVFNKSSEFYTSICYHFESPCDKDVALKDRLLAYYPNITLCDSGCTSVGVNLTTMTSICKCKFKNLTELEFDIEDNIYKDVVNEVNKILSQVNLDVMKCYKDLFKYEYFIVNTGGFIMLVFIFIQIIAFANYYLSSSFLIKKYIYNVTENYLLYLNKSPLVNTNIINFNTNIKKEKNEKNDENDNENENTINNKISCPLKKVLTNKLNKNNKVNITNNNKKVNKIQKNRTLKTQDGSKNKFLINSKHLKNQKLLFNKHKSCSSINLKKEKLLKHSKNAEKTNKSKKNTSFTFDNYLSLELEDMHFHDVAIIDRRLFFDYFCDKLKKKQLILQLFFINSPIKPLAIKILVLILNIEICFVVNAMFINEDYISKIFHSKKKETFTSFITRSIDRFIYTAFAIVVVNYFINCLFIEESKIKGVLKREKRDKYRLKYEINIIMKEVKIRFTLFNIITVAISLFSWFYISCFNNIYPHIKIEWIKSSIFIILLIHFFSIFIILIETLLRFISFEIKSEKMYRASLWLG